MRLLWAVVAGVLIVALVMAVGVRPANACSCLSLPSTPAEARGRLERTGASTIVIASVDQAWRDRIEPEADLRVERVFTGSVDRTMHVTSSNCNGIVVPFDTGERWILALTERDGEWQAHGCSAGVLDGELPRDPGSAGLPWDGDAWAAALDEAALGQPLPRWSDESSLSYPAVALIVVALGTAMLSVVYIGQRRRSG